MNRCAGSRDDLYVHWVSLNPKGIQSNQIMNSNYVANRTQHKAVTRMPRVVIVGTAAAPKHYSSP